MASIEERKNKQGRITSYRVKWRDKNGKQYNQSVKDRASAEKWKALLEAAEHDTKAAERALLRTTSTKPPLHVVAREHLDRLIVRPYTITKYEGYIKNHLDPIGNLPVDKITDNDLIQWVKWMMSRGKAPKTIANVHGFIHGVMDTAVSKKYREDNPCHGKYLPEDDATEDKSTFLTMAEFNTIAEHVPGHNLLAFRFLISTGLRLGEMTALLVEDLLLDAQVPSVRVTKSDQYERGKDGQPGRWIVGPPKTPESRRTVSLPPSVVTALAGHVADMNPGDRVFTSRPGSVSAAHRTWQKTWTKAVNEAIKYDGLTKDPRIHDLRHSHASLMIAAGMNLFDLSKRLGHKNVQTTTGVYGHLMPGAHFKAANLMEQVLAAPEVQEVH